MTTYPHTSADDHAHLASEAAWSRNSYSPDDLYDDLDDADCPIVRPPASSLDPSAPDDPF